MGSSERLSGRFWCLIASTFLGFLGFGTVLPALAPHVRNDLGGTDRAVGFIIGTFSVVALSSRPFVGLLADRKGRKHAFLTGLASCTLAGLSYLLPWGLSGLYLGRTLQGIGEACLYTGAAALTIEVAGVHRSARALGYLSSGIWGGYAAGPLIGQLLGSFSNAARFQVIAALTAAALLSRVPEDYQPSAHARRRRWLQPHLIPAGISVGFVNVHYPVITGFLILHLARHGNAGPAAFSTYAGFVLLSRFFLGACRIASIPGSRFTSGFPEWRWGWRCWQLLPDLLGQLSGLDVWASDFPSRGPLSHPRCCVIPPRASADRPSASSARSTIYLWGPVHSRLGSSPARMDMPRRSSWPSWPCLPPRFPDDMSSLRCDPRRDIL